MPNGPPTFEELLEAAPDAMVGSDAAGVAVFANERAKELLGRDPIGEPLGELPPDWTWRARRWASTSSWSSARSTRGRCAPCSTTRTAAIFLKDPEGRYLLVNRAFERLHGKPAVEPDRPARPRGAAAGGRRPDAGRRPAGDVLARADRAPGGGHARRADADVPLGQVPADRRAHRRALRRRRRSRPTSRTTSGWRRACARRSGWRPSASSRAASRTTSTTCSRWSPTTRRSCARSCPTTAARRATWTRSSPPRGARPSSRAGCCCSRAASPARPRCCRCGA